MKWKLAVAATAAALLCAPTASATPQQDQLLYDAMGEAGIDLYPAAVPAAYAVCADAWSGTDLDYEAGVVLAGNSGWTLDQARTFVVVAILIYCPPEESAHKKMAV